MMPELAAALPEILANAQQTGQRALLWISGTADNCWQQLNLCLQLPCMQAPTLLVPGSALSATQCSDSGSTTAAASSQVTRIATQAHLLGLSSERLIFDALHGFDPDRFCLASGTLSGGGLLVLLTPRTDPWLHDGDADYDSMLVYPYQRQQIRGLFIKRLLSFLQNTPWLASWDADHENWRQQGWQSPVLWPISLAAVRHQPHAHHDFCYTAEQQQLAAAVIKVATGRANRPLIITADRGRGKSAAIGLGLAQLLMSRQAAGRKYSIWMTAPHKNNLRVLMQHLQTELDSQQEAAAELAASVKFMPPDALLRAKTGPDLLVIDEAAAIPEQVLKACCEKYSRLVFATTVQGYEGTGQGFALRFRPWLLQRFPQSQWRQLDEPIRWGHQDLLEAWLNHVFLLAVHDETGGNEVIATTSNLRVRECSQPELFQQPLLLQQLYGLLILAHYRTSPGDLRDLLDAPNFRIWILQHPASKGQQLLVLGCCLMAIEGNLDEAISARIFQGERRPRGHLMPQLLSQGLGDSTLASLTSARVVRVAIHPHLQQQGLGSTLLKTVENDLIKDNIAYMGASFSAFADVIGFWQKNHYCPVHFGQSREASSGAQPLLVLKALVDNNPSAEASAAEKIKHWTETFFQRFIFSLANENQFLDPEVVAAILATLPPLSLELRLTQAEKDQLTGFCGGYRTLSNCRWLLFKAAVIFISEKKLTLLANKQQQLLILFLLQQQSFAEIQAEQHIKGKKSGLAQLRELTETLLEELA